MGNSRGRVASAEHRIAISTSHVLSRTRNQRCEGRKRMTAIFQNKHGSSADDLLFSLVPIRYTPSNSTVDPKYETGNHALH